MDSEQAQKEARELVKCWRSDEYPGDEMTLSESDIKAIEQLILDSVALVNEEYRQGERE